MNQQFAEREVLELADRLICHEMLVEKLGFLSHQSQSQELQQTLKQHQQTYLRHYNEMAALLQQAQQGQQAQQQGGWQGYSERNYQGQPSPSQTPYPVQSPQAPGQFQPAQAQGSGYGERQGGYRQ